MNPAETAAILRQFNEWRRGEDEDIPQPAAHKITAAIDAAVEMIDRLEAAEKAVTEAYQRGYETGQEEVEKERDALLAKVAEMERQEPVAWYSKQYGFVYMSRQPSQFEHGSILYLRNGAPAWRIEGSSKVALLDIASLPHGTVFYALPGAQPAPSAPEGWIQRGMAELEAIRNRQDDDTLLDDRTLIERIGKAMLAAAPEAKP